MFTTILTVTFVAVSFCTTSVYGVLAQECSGTIREDGVFLSPDPLNTSYKHHEKMECIWHIEAPEDKRVVLKILEYSLKRAYTCTNDKDHIAIFNGITTSASKRLAFLCSRGKDLVIPSTGNSLTVKFKTASFNENRGFISQIVFTYPESVGCGGNINLESNSSYTLKSPEVKDYKEGDVFECLWNFKAPENYAIRISFSSFEKFTCNYSHLLEIKDGIVPDSLVLASFCGEKGPPSVVSSANRLSVRLSSFKMLQFTATVTVEKAACSPSLKYVHYTSPGYRTETLARGINCGYEFRSMSSSFPVRLTIKHLDIQPSTETGKCNSDKLIVSRRGKVQALGKYYNVNNKGLYYLTSVSKLRSVYDGDKVMLAQQYEICGKKTAEFYFVSTFFLNLITAPGSDPYSYKGFEIDVLFANFCGRNYTEPYGRILSGPSGSLDTLDDCYTLISAPEGYTISLYFISFQPDINNDIIYVDFYDGKTTKSNKLVSTQSNVNITAHDIPKPIFSTGNYILIKNKRTSKGQTSLDLNYMITKMGQGCGGYYYGDQGVVASPFYPEKYQKNTTCEWDLETPGSTRLHMLFDEFYLTGDCNTNYVELVNREGNVLSRFCSEKPGVFTSTDNYVKIVYVTGSTNTGKGWHAMFGAVYTV